MNGEEIEETEPMFQSINEAGVNNESEIADAQKEWEEKGTDSKYFKKWFGDSKVVDNEGKPLVVYHGTESEELFDIFETGSPDGTPAIYFSSNKKVANSYSAGNPIYQVYLNIENPFVVDAQGKAYNDFTAEMRSNIDWAVRNGYDGVIVKNIRDGWAQDKGGENADTYIVFNSEQIKSVNNRGTFDRNNPNIYYQSDYNQLSENQKENLFAKEFIDDEQIKNDEKVLDEDITKHLSGEMSFGAMINFGKAPVILQHFGVPNKNMLMSQNKYDCSTNRKVIKGSIHNISDDVMKKLPELLSNPLMIALPTKESKYKGNNRYVVTINELDNDGKPINVIIDYDWHGNKINIIPSVYGREEFDDYIKNCIQQNKIIYTNKKVLTSRTRVQFPRGSKNSINIITDKEDIIKSIVKKNNNVHFQSAYHGTPHRFDEFSTENIGTGEGAQAHGWGLYFAENKEVSEKYREKLVSRSMNGFNEYTFTINDEPVSEDINFFLSNNLNGGVLYNAANTENAESQKELIDSIKWHIDYLRKGDASTVRLIKMLQEAIDKIENNPQISITKFLKEVPEYEKYRFKTLANVAKREAKEEGKKANIQYLLKWIKEQQKPFLEERNKQLKTLAELEKLDIENIKIKRRTGQLFEVDVPEDEVLLDEDKELVQQPEKVQRAIEKIYSDAMKNNDIGLANAIVQITGRDVYKELAKYFGSPKEASELLNKYGIKGITYNGLQDGRCYVIFDDKAVQVLNTFYQGEGEDLSDKRGFTLSRQNFDGTMKDNLIVLLKNKTDKSTLLHEFAHVYIINVVKTQFGDFISEFTVFNRKDIGTVKVYDLESYQKIDSANLDKVLINQVCR